MRGPAIPYSRAYLDAQDEAAVAAVIREGRLVQGESVAAFEAAVAAFCGRRHAVATSSGTSALQLALQGQGVGPGWDVLVPAYTWVATYNVPLQLGARPVLVDVDPHSFCLDPEDTLRALQDCRAARRAIIPVHLFGYRAGGGWLAPLARSQGLVLLGDGCCAFGGEDGDARCGAWSEVECLSFHPRKVLTCGEGGMILLDDAALAGRLRRLRDHGAERSPEQRRQTGHGGPLTPEFPEPGTNARMTEMQGALGLSQVRHLPEILAGRRRVARRYDALLRDGPPWLAPPPGGDDPGRLLTCYVARLWGDRARPPTDPEEIDRLARLRDRLLLALADEGIAARPPMVSLLDPPYVRSGRGPGVGFSGTQVAARLALGLPFFPQLADEDAARVVEALGRLGAGLWRS